MLNILIFAAGAAIMFWMGLRSMLARRRLCTKGEKVSARVTGTVQSTSGSAYVLEFETQGGSHHLQYPKPSRGKSFAAGQTVTLYYDPDDLDKLYVEGDKAMLGAEILYYALGAALLVLMFGLMGEIGRAHV